MVRLIIFTVSFTLVLNWYKTKQNKNDFNTFTVASRSNIEFHSMPNKWTNNDLNYNFQTLSFVCVVFIFAIVYVVSRIFALPSLLCIFFTILFPLPFFFALVILHFFVILVCFKHTFHHHCHCPFEVNCRKNFTSYLFVCVFFTCMKNRIRIVTVLFDLFFLVICVFNFMLFFSLVSFQFRLDL